MTQFVSGCTVKLHHYFQHLDLYFYDVYCLWFQSKLKEIYFHSGHSYSCCWSNKSCISKVSVHT